MFRVVFRKMFMFLALIVALVCTAAARSANGHSSQSLVLNERLKFIQSLNITTSNSLHLLYRIYESCHKEHLLTCLKVKLLAGLDSALRYPNDINIMKGVALVRSKDLSSDSINQKSEQNIELDLPRSVLNRSKKLDALILNRILSLVQSRTLRIQHLNKEDNYEGNWESRKKKDKKNNGAFVMIPLLLGGTFIPIAYGALAFLAGKALIVSKLALVLASIIGIKKLLSNNSLKESQHEVVVSGGHGSSSGWGRDIDLAYNGYNAKEEVKEKV